MSPIFLRHPPHSWEKDHNAIIQAAKRWARKFNVVPDFHPKDFLLHLHLTGGSFENVDSAVRFYFEDARKSALKLFTLIYEQLDYNSESKIKLLEFASGYGCVTRHLGKIFGSNVEVTACEIHRAAVDFIVEKLKIQSVLSHSVQLLR